MVSRRRHPSRQLQTCKYVKNYTGRKNSCTFPEKQLVSPSTASDAHWRDDDEDGILLETIQFLWTPIATFTNFSFISYSVVCA